MATVFLSIGMPKTGTTAIQSFLRENEGLLKEQGYCFPVLWHEADGGYKNRNGHFLLCDAEEQERQFRKIEKLAKTYPNIILSDEAIWKAGYKRRGFWKAAAERFGQIGCRLRVIVYLRRQDLLVQSLWNQNIKSKAVNWTKTFDECIEQDSFSYFPLDYHKGLTKIAEHVDQSDMIVRVYEQGQFEGEGNTIFSDLLRCVGADISKPYTDEKVKSNLGLRDNLIEIKRIINSAPGYRGMGDFMSRPVKAANDSLIQDGLHADTSMFSYEEQKKFLKKFEEGNRRIAQEFLGRPDGRLFYQDVEELPKWEMDRERIYRDITVVVTEALCEQEKKILRMQEDLRLIQDSVFFKAYRKVCRALDDGGEK